MDFVDFVDFGSWVMRLDCSVFRLPRKQSKTCEFIGPYLRTPRMTPRMPRVDSEKLKTKERLDLTLDWHRLVVFSGKLVSWGERKKKPPSPRFDILRKLIATGINVGGFFYERRVDQDWTAIDVTLAKLPGAVALRKTAGLNTASKTGRNSSGCGRG